MPNPSLASVYRIDRFKVPSHVAADFLERLHHIQDLLDTQAGCRQNLVLTQQGDGGMSQVLTLVEWESMDAMVHARQHMQTVYAAEGFNPAEYMRSLGVEAEFGSYSSV